MMNATSPASARRADLLAAGAATVTVVLWASAFVSIRSAGAAYSPGALALGRLLAGSVTLGALARDLNVAGLVALAFA
ncbi:hypothetical protein ABT086_44805, partial [Streptomyces mirabilis]